MNFKVYTLQELATIKYGKSQKKVVSDNGDIPIYGTGGLMGYAIQSLYDKPSVLIGRKGTIDRVHYVTQPFWTVDTLFYTEINNSIVLPHYLYYLLSILDLKQYNEGTTIPSLRTETLNRLEFNIPSIKNQQKILAILEPLEYKIELNNKINKNLEQQAQAIFKSWFVDFEPFGGIMPSDWSIVPLSQIASFVNGYSYKSNELISSTTAMTTIKNFERKSGFKLDGFKEILPSGKIKTEQYVELFDVLVAHTDLTQNAEIIGNAELILSFDDYDNVVFSMDLVKVQPKIEKISKFLIFAILKDRRFKEHCLGYTNGTTVLHLSKKALSEYKLILPKDLSILFPLDEIITIFYKQIASNVEENKKLKNLKDTLLPKLMSGEIDISEIDI